MNLRRRDDDRRLRGAQSGPAALRTGSRTSRSRTSTRLPRPRSRTAARWSRRRTTFPGVGRTARIADPQGAELSPFRNAVGIPPDALPPSAAGWNVAHTSDPTKALSFYEKVLGFSPPFPWRARACTYHHPLHGRRRSWRRHEPPAGLRAAALGCPTWQSDERRTRRSARARRARREHSRSDPRTSRASVRIGTLKDSDRARRSPSSSRYPAGKQG